VREGIETAGNPADRGWLAFGANADTERCVQRIRINRDRCRSRVERIGYDFGENRLFEGAP
jgi:hypothetical protein